MPLFQRAALLLLLALFGASQVRADAVKFEHRGFTVDETAVQSLPNLAALRTATKEQIDIVLSVDLPKEIITFFQSVPFHLVQAEAIKGPTPGVYGGGRVRVSTNMIRAGHKPILLHEYLHAYHEQKMPKANRNPEILAFYEKAKTLGVYAAKSHMMENQNEFFACAGTTFLFGLTAQEPFQRDKVKTNQPELHAFLQKLFGPDAGKHEGSLTSPAVRPAQDTAAGTTETK